MGTTAAGIYLPLATVLVKGDTMAVVIRGTETFGDWEAGELMPGTGRESVALWWFDEYLFVCQQHTFSCQVN
jgi:hypothetical protein